MSDFLNDPSPLPRCHACWNVTRCCTCEVTFTFLGVGELTYDSLVERGRQIIKEAEDELTLDMLRRAYQDAVYGGSRERFLERWVAHQARDLDSELRDLLS